MRDGFIFYASFHEAISQLDDANQLELYKAVVTYGLTGEEPTLEGIAKAMFTLIKPQLDANQKRYENGKKGGRPKTETKPKENLTKTKVEPKEKEKEKEKVKENDKDNAFSFNLSKAMQYNSLSKSYQDKLYGYAVVKDGAYQLQSFIDHNLSKGGKFKDWSRGYNTWVKNSVEFSKGSYNPETYRKIMTNHPDYEAVYVPYGENKVFSEEFDYICEFDVREQVEVVTGNEPTYNPGRDITKLMK